MSLTLLFLAIFCFVTLSISALILLTKRKIILLFFIPIMFILLASTVHTYSELLGFPTSRLLPEKFFVISHLVDEPKIIYLWVLKSGIKIPVAHQIPYNKKMHEQLDNLQKEIEEGEKGVIQGITNILQESHFVLYHFDQRPDMEKNSSSHRFPGRPDLRRD